MEPLNLVPALAQLLDHAIEVSAKIANLIIPFCEPDFSIEVSVADAGNLLLQFHHRTLNQVSQRDDQHGANCNRACTGYHEHRMTFGVTQGNSRKQEEQQSVQQNERDRQDRLDFPIHPNGTHSVPPPHSFLPSRLACPKPVPTKRVLSSPSIPTSSTSPGCRVGPAKGPTLHGAIGS